MKANLEGFDAFDEELQSYLKTCDDDNVVQILKAGADELISDVRALPSPRSNITKATHTHLLDAVSGKAEGNKYIVGWGVYYGPIVEAGHTTPKGTKVSARAHLRPTLRDNRQKYESAMQKKFAEIGGH